MSYFQHLNTQSLTSWKVKILTQNHMEKEKAKMNEEEENLYGCYRISITAASKSHLV